MVLRWTASVFKGSWELFRVHPHLRMCDPQMRKECQIGTSMNNSSMVNCMCSVPLDTSTALTPVRAVHKRFYRRCDLGMHAFPLALVVTTVLIKFRFFVRTDSTCCEKNVYSSRHNWLFMFSGVVQYF